MLIHYLGGDVHVPYPSDADVNDVPDVADVAASTSIDTTVPSTARVYDAALGGKENYEVDRQLLEKIDRLVPQVGQLAVINRNFLNRACRFLARQTGIEQFLDCGSGLPTAENVHQTVHRHNPHARVVYVDNDPIVIAHGRALLEEDSRTRFAAANIFDPDEVLYNETVADTIDWSEPMVFLQVATMHFCDDESDPAAIMRTYIDALPSGSYVVFSHTLDPQDEHHEVAKQIQQNYAASGGNLHFRTREQLEPMLAGLDILDPGLVSPSDWWPVGPREEARLPVEQCGLAAVARKP